MFNDLTWWGEALAGRGREATITNPIEARLCRYAQYRGEKATLMLNGLPVTGKVRSVMEDRSSTPMRWIVSVIPKQGIAA
jgi:hypothetical protein